MYELCVCVPVCVHVCLFVSVCCIAGCVLAGWLRRGLGRKGHMLSQFTGNTLTQFCSVALEMLLKESSPLVLDLIYDDPLLTGTSVAGEVCAKESIFEWHQTLCELGSWAMGQGKWPGLENRACTRQCLCGDCKYTHDLVVFPLAVIMGSKETLMLPSFFLF